MRILVTGGAGYIGSVLTDVLLSRGHRVVVLDDLSTGHRDAVAAAARFVKGGIGDSGLVRSLVEEEQIQAVIHMAARAVVSESVRDPAHYYRNNVTASLALLDTVVDAGVKLFVFSSSAAVYGEPVRVPIDEDMPPAPTNPYGETKLAFERALHWYRAAYGLRYAVLRYFNAAGASDTRRERHDPETHLIPLVLDAVAGSGSPVTVFGSDYPTPDGTCVRDYIHVVDLAEAHVLALEALADPRSPLGGELVYNLGCGGSGYSVLEVIRAASRIAGRSVPFTVGPRRPGDPPVLVAASDRIRRELGWAPRLTDIESIIATEWRHRKKEGA